MRFALSAYSSVLPVSSAHRALGLTVATTHVFERPPRASRRSRVSFESLYGTCAEWTPSLTRAAMTRPRVSSDLLISPASRDRISDLFAPERPTFSDPARSTRFSFPTTARSSPSSLVVLARTVSVKTECERLECALQRVSAVRLRPTPRARRAKISPGVRASASSRFRTETPPRPSSMSAWCAEREAPWDAGANELLTDDAAAVSSDDGPPPVGFPASGLL